LDEHGGSEAEHGGDHEMDEGAPEVFAPAHAAQGAREIIELIGADIIDGIDVVGHQEEGGEEADRFRMSAPVDEDGAGKAFEDEKGEVEEERKEHHDDVHWHEQFDHDVRDGRLAGIFAAGVVDGALGDGDMGLGFVFSGRLDQIERANELAGFGVVFGFAARGVGNGRAGEGDREFIGQRARADGGEIIMGRAEVFVGAAAEGSGEVGNALGLGVGGGFAEAEGAIFSGGVEVFEGGNIAEQAAIRALDGAGGHIHRDSEPATAVAGEANEIVVGGRRHDHSITTERVGEFAGLGGWLEWLL